MITKQKTGPGQPVQIPTLSRRLFLGAAAAGIGGLALPGTAQAALGGMTERGMADAGRSFIFDIMKGNERIGAHRLSLREEGTRLLVDVRIRIKVKFGFITAFSYSHSDQEVWDGQQLVSLNAQTHDNGQNHFVSAHPGEGGLLVTSSSGDYIAPADVMSSSYWRYETVRQKSLLNTQTGLLTDIQVTDQGQDHLSYFGHEIPAHRYRLCGPKRQCDVWYGVKNGQWLGLEFTAHGAQISYRPREETVISAL